MILGEENKPPLEDLIEHYGVPGMKWGHRKKRVTTADIKEARGKVDKLGVEVNRTGFDLVKKQMDEAPKSTLTKATKAHQKALLDYDTSDALLNANRFTNGEKAALIILTGPFAAIPIAQLALHRQAIRKQQTKLKLKTKT